MSGYDEIGGAGSVKAVVAVLYQRVLGDPDLIDYFREVDLDRLKAHQRAFLTQALGGPDLFAGRSMAEAHAGLDITDASFDALLEHLLITLHDLGVPDHVVAGVRGAIEPLRAEVVSARPAPVDH
ncbi:group 1 truncated hemoglobin [Nocardioides sp.]|uniref:group I truncated hemoglobin n=1 Tax=Nocardioides sp. TaxID=35761 RepID=UPI0027371687|nr:group 1 truncated hemoglobin [Nocardioides sp.]MDP3892229.1 group 1 truncated hemoglobin [Nocardioides sp.]